MFHSQTRSSTESKPISILYNSKATCKLIKNVKPQLVNMPTIMETTVSTGLEVLQTITGNMKATGISNYYQIGTGAQIAVVLCPEHANEIAASGLSKSDVQEFIYQNARMPMNMLVGRAHYGNRNWPSWIDQTDPETLVPIVRESKDLMIIVAGGDGRHSAWLAGWGVTRMASEEIIKHT